MTGYDSKREAAADKMQEPVDIASIIACREMLDAQPVPARTSVHETLKLALEALELDYTFEWPAMHRPKKAEKKRFEAITAIKEALAQPAQEKNT